MHLSIHRKAHKNGTLTLYVKGAPETILKLCSHIFVDGRHLPLSDMYIKEFGDVSEKLAEKGHRLLAFAQFLLPGAKFPDNYRFSLEKNNWPTFEYCLLGIVSLEDPPKPGVADAVHQLRSAGIQVVMVTGDHPRTAEVCLSLEY